MTDLGVSWYREQLRKKLKFIMIIIKQRMSCKFLITYTECSIALELMVHRKNLSLIFEGDAKEVKGKEVEWEGR